MKIIKEVNKNNDNKEIILTPQICLFNFNKADIDILKTNNYNITSGSFGFQIKIPNKKTYDENICLSNHDVPSNLHEFDILCFDMNDNDILEYDGKDNLRENEKNIEGLYFLTKFPQNIFDPRPFISSIFQDDISEFLTKKSIIIVFASAHDTFDYQFARMKASGYYKDGDKKRHSNYDFLNSLPRNTNKIGKKMKVEAKHTDLQSILNCYLNEFVYKITFKHPTQWDKELKKNVKKDNFYPMITNHVDEIVSFIELSNDSLLFVLPDLTHKGELLTKLLNVALPSIIPELFPFSSAFKWKEEKTYWLPNYQDLLLKKQNVTKNFEEEILQIEEKILSNTNKFQFLHDIISETGDILVDAVKQYLNWLEFVKVIKVDDEKEKIKEEDLRIELDDGIIVIEVKGIGGTSKDNECSQIDKIVHRRERERKKFDVKGLYIVNHQRYLPPINRENPPFTKLQIKDAIHDKRGLLTTWELFKLFDYISNGIITKKDALNIMFSPGLIHFEPLNTKYINKVNKIFKEGKIIIIKTSIKIKKGDSLIISKNDCYIKAKVLNLQLNGENIIEANNCEIGIEVDVKISKNSDIYLVD